MREALTFLAGLLVAALLAALLGPGFVDWREYRPQFEQRIGAALGLETRIAGAIGLRLLPSPRLTLGQVRLGSGEGETSAATIETLTAELALAPLARGEFRLTEAEADGLTLSLVADEAGAVALPVRQGAGLPGEAAIDRLAIRRAAVTWREPGKAAQTLAPVAVDVSAASLLGPWRVEGEVAGASVRVATGAVEADGRLRTKASVTGEQVQFSFDGALVLGARMVAFSPGSTAAPRLRPAEPSAWPGGCRAAAAASISPASRSRSPAAQPGWTARAGSARPRLSAACSSRRADSTPMP